jgi:hypothetical protein
MRLLRFLAVSFCVASLFVLSAFSFAQTAQTSQGSQNPSASKVSPADQANLQKQVQKMVTQALEPGGQREIPPLRLQRKDLEAKPVLDVFVDPGIVVRPASSECWSIVAYHFSHEQNPRLQSVTTCTPANGIIMRKAQREKDYQQPALPLVLVNSGSSQ